MAIIILQLFYNYNILNISSLHEFLEMLKQSFGVFTKTIEYATNDSFDAKKR